MMVRIMFSTFAERRTGGNPANEGRETQEKKGIYGNQKV